MDLLRVLINAIRSRFIRLFGRLRYLFTPGYIRTRVISRVTRFFSRLFDVRPRNRSDYYTIFRWQISRKLAFLIVVMIGVLSFAYIYTAYIRGWTRTRGEDIRTYDYDSILLKFAKGKVRIRGRSGYLAFEGAVRGGSCNGEGVLYDVNGGVVYRGNFTRSMYEDQGTRYYQDGTVWYTGDFHENLFQGTGRLYRENGSLEYDGEFEAGMKEGEGTLYDTAQKRLYEGSFTLDEIRYATLLGRTATELNEAYGGEVVIYDGDSVHVRDLREIGVMTLETADSDSVEESIYKINGVYVLRNHYRTHTGDCDEIAELTEVFGDPIYQGISRITLPEALSIRRLCDLDSQGELEEAEVSTEEVYTEYSRVLSYDQDYEVMLHTYSRDGLIYTFVGKPGSANFAFYYLVREDMSDLIR